MHFGLQKLIDNAVGFGSFFGEISLVERLSSRDQ